MRSRLPLRHPTLMTAEGEQESGKEESVLRGVSEVAEDRRWGMLILWDFDYFPFFDRTRFLLCPSFFLLRSAQHALECD